MTISLVRIDDRIIHGQITTRWTKHKPVYGILAVADDVAQDTLRKKVLKAAAGNYKLGIYMVDQAPEKIAKAMESDKAYFLITNSPQVIARLLEKGVDIGKVLNVGCMNARPGATVLGRSVAIDQKDYEAFDYIESKNVKIEFQLLPDDDPKSWQSMKKKYDSIK
ncbi:PTS system mannose/fructose/N-acetylgalactosamine-transporter subunit IIB [Cytobacillus sp. Hz8]|uniref:PTS system mannose/fructose/N-acetylgalactosamine-transporter subunit IIB n=1 Tax=Cytobacillus sp. Hz8 TaxID=3347168 RepID=UPI0035D677BA